MTTKIFLFCRTC